MSNLGGRKRGKEWSEVIVDGATATCCHCHDVLSMKIERIRNHLSKCVEYSRSLERNSSEHNIGELSEVDEVQPSPSSSKSQKIDKFISKTSEKEKENIDKQIGRAFFSNNFSFKSIENPEFLKACQMLRPGYNPPSRKKLGGEILETIFEDVEKEIEEELSKSSFLTISQDGWSNSSNDPIIAHSFHTGNRTFLHNIVDSGSQEKNSDYCFQLIDEAMEEIENKHKKEVFAVCTDNEAKMKKMRKHVAEADPTRLCYGCNAHYMNLLEKDILNNNPVLSKVKVVQKHFRNVHASHGALKEKGGRMPQIPVETRWNSWIDCLESYVQNHTIYLEIRGEKPDFDKDVGRLIDNIGLKREAGTLLDKMKIFSISLDKLQSDNCSLSDAFCVWDSLLRNADLVAYRGKIKKRMEDAMEPFFILARMTDNRYLQHSHHVSISDFLLLKVDRPASESTARECGRDLARRIRCLVDGPSHETPNKG